MDKDIQNTVEDLVLGLPEAEARALEMWLLRDRVIYALTGGVLGFALALLLTQGLA